MNEELCEELLLMQHEDQKISQELIDSGQLGAVEYHPKIREVHERNNARIQQIISREGWPGISLVGREAAEAAWLIVQHAVLDTAFMESCLELLQKAVKQGEAEGSHFAHLQDRVLTMSGRPQIYGTQHDVDSKGTGAKALGSQRHWGHIKALGSGFAYGNSIDIDNAGTLSR